MEILEVLSGIIRQNLQKYMENSGNPMGTNITNNLSALKYFYIAMAIKKYLCPRIITG